jgi:DNA-binding XRE family transcriptional regulator
MVARRHESSAADESGETTSKKTAFDPCAHWPKDLPRPRPWQAVIDLQRGQSAEESAVLEESIGNRGIQYPQVLLPDGRVVDGNKRGHLAKKLHQPVPIPIVLSEETTDEEALILARELQVGRRNLTADEWAKGKAAIEQFYIALRHSGLTQTEAAEKAGIPRGTGATWERKRRRLSETADTMLNVNTASTQEIPDKRRKLSDASFEEAEAAMEAGQTQEEAAKERGVTARTLRRRRKKSTPRTSDRPQADGIEDEQAGTVADLLRFLASVEEEAVGYGGTQARTQAEVSAVTEGVQGLVTTVTGLARKVAKHFAQAHAVGGDIGREPKPRAENKPKREAPQRNAAMPTGLVPADQLPQRSRRAPEGPLRPPEPRKARKPVAEQNGAEKPVEREVPA